MRIFPRINLPRFKTVSRKWRQWRRHLTIERMVWTGEGLIFGGVLAFMLTDGRAIWMDNFGQRADLVMLALVIILFVLLHVTLARRAVVLLERYFSPPKYDERQILFDLGQEARAATNTDELYKLILSRIGEALQAENVSIFVRNDVSGDFVCRLSWAHAAAKQIEAADKSRDPASSLVLSRDAFMITRLRRLVTPLVIEPGEYDTWQRALVSASSTVREARERERATLEQIKAQLLLPIRIKEQLVGVLSVSSRQSHHLYSSADKEMLTSVAGQLAFVIENSKLIERMAAEEQLRRELALAADVQRRLLPQRMPVSAGLEMSGFCQPARGVGGDYYDFQSCGDEQINFAIADVSGKGISAALVMSNVQASLRSQMMAQYAAAKRLPSSLVDLVSAMNELLCGSTGGATYVTFFCAQFNELSKQLTYVNAGHNPPFLLHRSDAAQRATAPAPTVSNGAVKSQYSNGGNGSNGNGTNGCLKLMTGGLAIGMFEQCQYEQETVQLQSGDLLVAYTDGLIEALNAKDEEFGEARLQEAIAATAHLSANEVQNELMRRVQAWCAGVPQYDDLTFIVLKVK